MSEAAGGPEGGGPWQEPAQAAWYEDFCARHGMYAEVARAAALALAPAPDARVLDLGSGTGVSTLALLEVLGPTGRVVGVDPARRMVEAARRRVSDARARFVLGEAGPLLARGEGPFDAALASSMIWLCEPLDDALVGLRRALQPGARALFTVPSEYLGEVDHLTAPAARGLHAALAGLRAGAGASMPRPARAEGLDSFASFGARLRAAGFEAPAASSWSRMSPPDEQRDWWGQPVVLAGLLGTADAGAHERARQALDEALRRAPALEQRWTLVVAEAR
ncbi:MAG: class I SAM-dependent methyltransferase [Deltaproteobacteria bacterium]|nr:class I SAM-dependent methyltransferase [Deltaproteobacteria bacterium]MCB9788964.1 class I SAM-dependent methyltransferase [Deltaproteobacteria bacterium]